MDWADDVTYAVHDVEDWYRLGLVPLEDLFRFDLPAGHSRAGHEEPRELIAFMDWLEDGHWDRGQFDRQEVVAQLHYLADKVAVAERFDGTRAAKGRLHTTVTDLITYFVDDVAYTGSGHAFDGTLNIPDGPVLMCEILKKLVWCYVIDRPALAAQQHGQARIVGELVEWIADDPSRLLPRDRQDEFTEHGDLTRAVADHVASLTEPMAIKLHAKLGGTDLGAITDYAAAAG
jgi:dGTPase